MKISEAINLNQHINMLVNKPDKFNSNFGYALGKNGRRLNSVMTSYSKHVKKLVEKYADRDEKGEPILLDAANGNYMVKTRFEEYQAAMQKFMETEVEITLHKIPMEMVPELPPAVVFNIMDMINNPAPEEDNREDQIALTRDDVIGKAIDGLLEGVADTPVGSAEMPKAPATADEPEKVLEGEILQ
jgi:hypothetical protein